MYCSQTANGYLTAPHRSSWNWSCNRFATSAFKCIIFTRKIPSDMTPECFLCNLNDSSVTFIMLKPQQRNREAGSSYYWILKTIRLSFSLPSWLSYTGTKTHHTSLSYSLLPSERYGILLQSRLQQTTYRSTNESTQRSYLPQLNWTGLRANTSFTTSILLSVM